MRAKQEANRGRSKWAEISAQQITGVERATKWLSLSYSELEPQV
jgi:hypothetical protein